MERPNVLLALQDGTALGRSIIEGVVDYARSRGVLGTWRFERVDEELHAFRASARPERIDGVIGILHPEWYEDIWPADQQHRLVQVSRARDVAGAINVTCDDAAIGRLAADYLIGKQLEHFAFFGPRDSGRRGEAFVNQIRRAGHDCRPAPSDAPQAEGDWLMELGRPCGVLAFNDIAATQLIELALGRGLDVPGDLAVVGVDDDLFVSMFSPVPLTSIAVDFKQVGREAARQLDRVFRGEPPPAEPIRIPPTRVVERHSTDYPGLADALAVRAARMIREGACEGVSVERIAEALPVTYRTLDRRFQKAFGRSMYDMITDVRMAEARRLLATTRLPMWAVCQRIGLGNTNYFNTVFRKHVGTPPAQYRRRHQPNRDTDKKNPGQAQTRPARSGHRLPNE